MAAVKPLIAAINYTPSMTEADLLRGVLDLARVLGWRVAHFRPARTAHGWRTPVAADGEGWPDLFLVRGSRRIAAELKTAKGKPTTAQASWLAALDEAGVEVFVWRPADYPETIAAVLTSAIVRTVPSSSTVRSASTPPSTRAAIDGRVVTQPVGARLEPVTARPPTVPTGWTTPERD